VRHDGWRVTGILRVRHRTLQTPVARYRHRGSGRVVTLVGTMHIGEKTYYERLHALVSGLEAAGASVHYEWIRPAAEEEWAAASDSERALRPGMWKDQDRAALAACRYLGWIPQPFPLGNAASWHNSDLTDLELIRRAGPGIVRERQRAAEEADFTDDELEMMLGAGMTVYTRLLALDRFGLLQRLAKRVALGDQRLDIDGVAIGERNRTALAALPPGGDVVLLWGAGHLPGLATGLRNAGYRRQSIEWVTVGTVPALQASARAIWTALHSS
jgi:hypothetical protein